MISFSENQTHNLADEQACGGYSLAAVLVEMEKTLKLPNAKRGTSIYKEIQKLQKESEITNRLLGGICKNNQSLPSFICQVAIVHKLTKFKVCYSQDILREAFMYHLPACIESEKIAEDAIREEAKRIGDDFVECLDEQKIKENLGSEEGVYYIVLVNNATHWVVIQRDNEGYWLYNPAKGKPDKTDDLPEIYFSGLYIKCYK